MPAFGDGFVDESGQRVKSLKSSDHFLMGGIVVRPNALGRASKLLADMRRELRRHPGDHLTWKNIKGHSDRLKAAQMLGSAGFLRIANVIVCKRDFEKGKGNIPSTDFAYLYTLRFLLERMSWLARDMRFVLRYTLSQIGGFGIPKLREYERLLRALPDCTVSWESLDPKGGSIDQPQRLEYLQLADIAVSATAQAFEPDPHGNTERRYLDELRPRLYTYPGGEITSYGLKMHPWNAATKAAHPWLLDW